MNRRHIIPLNLKRCAHTLALSAAFLSVLAYVGVVRVQGQDQHSDMQKMPGMDMSNKKKPTPQASPSPAPTPGAGQSQQGRASGMGDMKTGGGMMDMGPMLTRGVGGDIGVK